MQPISSKKKAKKLKLKRKFGAATPRQKYVDFLSSTLLFVLLAFVIFLLGGGLYDLVESPPPLITIGRRVFFYFPYDLSNQVILESLFSMILFGLGFVGALLAGKSVKYSNRRLASMVLIGGMILFLLGFLGVYLVMKLKLPSF
ncbi:hypothetical protein DRO26_02350 [Candidatus Bathyarchaeota archaeon]|nr:MAG: hypothetical protein DRO26_02350 [Candidatus Bathyarchaeota archaeon]